MGHFVSAADGGGGVPADLRSTYTAHGQEQVFKYVDSGAIKSGSEEMAALVAQLRTIDPERMGKLYLSTKAGEEEHRNLATTSVCSKAFGRWKAGNTTLNFKTSCDTRMLAYVQSGTHFV